MSSLSASPQELLWLNGRISPVSEGRIAVEDRGFNFADGIYEVVRIYDGRAFMMREHLERWENSARGIMLDSPGTMAEREQRLMDLLRRSGLRDALLYGQLTRGASRRNHVFPVASQTPPTELWIAREYKPHAAEHFANGVALLSQPDERWARCDLKTISLLPNVLAKERARRAGCFEALLWREDGAVTECAASNAWCVAGGTVYTHPLDNRILPGITRIAILDAARRAGVTVREESVTLGEFRAADEAFISSTTMEIMPVTRVDAAVIGNGRVGAVTRRLMEAMADVVRENLGAVPAAAR